MFSTFSADLSATDPRSQKPTSAPRPKRNQVARACDWCRLNRIKCDDKQPCHNCRARGGQCSNTKLSEPSTLPAATKEIQRLRDRIKNLEGQLKDAKTESENTGIASHQRPPSPHASATGPSSPQSLLSTPRKTWQGIPDPDAQTGTTVYYGPLSASYLVTRMSRHLCHALNQSNLEVPFPAHISPTTCLNSLQLLDSNSSSIQLGVPEVQDLSRAQEEQFLDLLWQSFHCMYPVILEADFRAYYDSLWAAASNNQSRQPSALVDALLAVCIEYGSKFMMSDEEGSDDSPGSRSAEATRLAHSFYRRSQQILTTELESPTILSLQGHIYGIIYLYNASLRNTAHAALGLAIRVAQMLRLHLPSLDGTPINQRELNSRIWFTLYQLDNQISMALGRPSLINPGDATCDFPKDTNEASLLSGTMLRSAKHEDISWLTFHTQHTRLTSMVRAAHSAFQARCTDVLQSTEAQDIYDDPQVLESLASVLDREVRPVYEWAKNVPASLKIQRKGASEPFSADRTALDMDPASPLWLQRQRCMLELIYHHMQLSTFRPFLRFPPRGASMTPLSDCHSITCLNHATTLTNLLHQVLSKTDLLRGWSPVFHYQWDATVCILGFVLGNPVCAPTPGARKCLRTAIESLEIMGHYFPAANSAAQIAREIANRVEMLAEQFRTRLTPQSMSQQSTPPDQLSKAIVPTTSAPLSPETVGPGMSTEYFRSLMNMTTFDATQPMAMGDDMQDRTHLAPDNLMSPPMTEAGYILPGNFGQWAPGNSMVLDSWGEYGSE